MTLKQQCSALLFLAAGVAAAISIISYAAGTLWASDISFVAFIACIALGLAGDRVASS